MPGHYPLRLATNIASVTRSLGQVDMQGLAIQWLHNNAY
jgi:hypothetical protein